MSTTTADQVTTTDPTTRPWRLGGRTRKLVLVLHIASVGAWLGIDVVMAVLIFGGMFTDDYETKAIGFKALELVAVWPMTISGLTCLVTGVLLAYGGKYGLTKYWWVVIKLVLNLLLTTLVLIALRPPTVVYSPSCNTRSRRVWASGGMSPISSRNKVPPSACSKRP